MSANDNNLGARFWEVICAENGLDLTTGKQLEPPCITRNDDHHHGIAHQQDPNHPLAATDGTTTGKMSTNHQKSDEIEEKTNIRKEEN
ncbi:unnamed protein product [Microthlaspi erraticum]|uniref:Tubulin/FtsZ GTPase domain-containing protein n=1 Tax=Microthlaspi erraticum TaxID=1685480 RepID=A0A6D2J632_9BRAS|nr:unnamed protein product [Microthlaspi erraticum]